MLVLLMFRSVMVHIKGTYVFLGRTIPLVEIPRNALRFICCVMARGRSGVRVAIVVWQV
jgi:hypothetical protein